MNARPESVFRILLGHASIGTTKKHYALWVKARQNRLDELVMATWKG